jgi:hypothetical protein
MRVQPRKQDKSSRNMRRRLFLGLLTTLLVVPAGICSPQKPTFSGTWKQSNERCVPKRTGDVIRHIDHHGSDLVVETTILRSSGPPRRAVQRYRTDGSTSVSTGADGDEFHTSIVWKDQSLMFSIEEHEDGRVIISNETWTLIENGSELRVDRENPDVSADRTRKQTLIYLRQSPDVVGR